MNYENRDVFVCHSSEDKDEIVRPLVEAFSESGISSWYDEAEIGWGDSIAEKVNEGLRISTYVIVVFSPSFMGKNWPKRELNAILNVEATTAEVKVLPLLVGNEIERKHILSSFPLLNDKMFLPWEGNTRQIVSALESRLKKGEGNSNKHGRMSLGINIPLPKIRKEFTQRDKDLFLKNSFIVVRDYFKQALKEIETQYSDVDVDFVEIHTFKFLATIYLKGEVANKCKIWFGGSGRSVSIGFQEGDFGIDSDSSYNDMLSVTSNGERLGFTTTLSIFRISTDSESNIMSPESAAEYLWNRFTESLG